MSEPDSAQGRPLHCRWFAVDSCPTAREKETLGNAFDLARGTPFATSSPSCGGLTARRLCRRPGVGRWWGIIVVVGVCGVLSGPLHAQLSLAITEFVAANADGLRDVDGDAADWIEIYNFSGTPQPLTGWSLTDARSDPRKWVFPDVELAARSFLVVFASGKDKLAPDGELHTNFRLRRDGEYLALVDPGGDVISEFAPQYPAQHPFAAFGPRLETRTLGEWRSGDLRYLVPTGEELSLEWVTPDFDDSAWSRAPAPIGFDFTEELKVAPAVRTDVSEGMLGVNPTLYARLTFEVESVLDVSSLLLRMRFDDGFIAYLNGVEVARAAAPSEAGWRSTATSERPGALAVQFEHFALPSAIEHLRTGENVLAIHALNAIAADPDFLLAPEIEVVRLLGLDASEHEFSAEPTPGAANRRGFAHVAPPPTASHAAGVYHDALSLSFASSLANATIRFTTDGSAPTEFSPVFSAPLLVDVDTIVRARVFALDHVPSPIGTREFILLDPELLDFSSNLPVFVLSTFARQLDRREFAPALLALFEPEEDGGQARLAAAPHLTHSTGLRVRGSSTGRSAKSSFAVEIWDDDQDDEALEILGMPASSDWVLYGALDYDPALIRNDFMYALSNRIGRYAVRTQFCEVFSNPRGGRTSMAHYMGVYSFMERIKLGPERVDVEPLGPADNAEPEISGGYMLKIDRGAPGDVGLGAGGQGMLFVEPKRPTAAQKAWIESYINEFAAVLDSDGFTDPQNGYHKYIGVDEWIDHHILNEFARNPDGLALSTYLYKQRGGKLNFGPIWDFDRTMGSMDGRSTDPYSWRPGTFTDFRWWSRLFTDPAFWEAYKARWGELRRGPMRTENLLALVDSLVETIGEAGTRNEVRWFSSRIPGRWMEEVERLKSWIEARVFWIDSQFVALPQLSHPGGRVDSGFELEITADDAGAIYYTLDGTDPLVDFAVSPSATRYSGPIRITRNVRVTARSQTGDGRWSEAVSAPFVVELMPLVVSEIMYNPLEGANLEFIELVNAGTEPVDLAGVRFVAGVAFDFSRLDDTALAPGEYIVAARSASAVKAKYGDVVRAVGPVGGSLHNSGEEIVLLGPLGEELQRFTYDGTWFTAAREQGHSIVIIDPSGPPSAWSERDGWRASLEPGGSPGRSEADETSSRRLVGDVHADGRLNVADAIAILLHLTRGGIDASCSEGSSRSFVLDASGDGSVDLGDALHLLNYLFRGGEAGALSDGCRVIPDCAAACP